MHVLSHLCGKWQHSFPWSQIQTFPSLTHHNFFTVLSQSHFFPTSTRGSVKTFQFMIFQPTKQEKIYSELYPLLSMFSPVHKIEQPSSLRLLAVLHLYFLHNCIHLASLLLLVGHFSLRVAGLWFDEWKRNAWYGRIVPFFHWSRLYNCGSHQYYVWFWLRSPGLPWFGTFSFRGGVLLMAWPFWCPYRRQGTISQLGSGSLHLSSFLRHVHLTFSRTLSISWVRSGPTILWYVVGILKTNSIQTSFPFIYSSLYVSNISYLISWTSIAYVFFSLSDGVVDKVSAS